MCFSPWPQSVSLYNYCTSTVLLLLWDLGPVTRSLWLWRTTLAQTCHSRRRDALSTTQCFATHTTPHHPDIPFHPGASQTCPEAEANTGPG